MGCLRLANQLGRDRWAFGFMLAPSGLDDCRAVHDVAHPQLSGPLVGEAPEVLSQTVGMGTTHQPMLFEQAVYNL